METPREKVLAALKSVPDEGDRPGRVMLGILVTMTGLDVETVTEVCGLLDLEGLVRRRPVGGKVAWRLMRVKDYPNATFA